MCETCNCRDRAGNEKGVHQVEVTPELTPQMMEEFRHLFEEWRQEDLNQDCLEEGGTGNLEDLARRTLHWLPGRKEAV